MACAPQQGLTLHAVQVRERVHKICSQTEPCLFDGQCLSIRIKNPS